jgi:signal transduction histidine kinase/ligand-binding sensor domain-containing protein
LSKSAIKNILFIFVLFCIRILNAQNLSDNFKFENISIEKGLSQSTVETIHQDKIGFIWFGTNDGLNRYNGYSFTVYRHDPADEQSISDSYIYDLAEDSAGYIWVGTNNGLNKFNPSTEKFKQYLHSPNTGNTISDKIIHSIEVDNKNNLWAATLNNGLNIYIDSSDSFVSVIPVYKDEEIIMISKISILNGNHLYLGTFNGRAFTYDLSGFRLTGVNPQVLFMSKIVLPQEIENAKENIIWDFKADKNGNLWICTNKTGIVKLNNPTREVIRYSNEMKDKYYISDKEVHNVLINSKGEIWLGTKSGGINVLYPNSDSFINITSSPGIPDGLNDNGIWCIYEDRSANIWIGTEFGGVNLYSQDRFKFEHYINPGGTSNNQIWALLEDHKGAIWIGTDGGGLNSFDPKTKRFQNNILKHKDYSDGSGKIITALLEDNDKNLWICTDGGGLKKYVRSSSSIKTFFYDPKNPETISSNAIKSAYINAHQKIWIGTYGYGVCLFDPESGKAKRFFRDEDTLKIPEADFPYALLENDGILWIGTYGNGLIKYEIASRKFKVFKYNKGDPASLSDNKITSLYLDSKNNLWVGTGRGLNLLNIKENNFTVYTVAEGLSNDVIYSILEDDSGQLWLSTNKGLSRFDPIHKVIKNFTLRDGLQAFEFNRGAAFKLRNGDLLFGGINGFNLIPGKQIFWTDYSPKVVITSFRKMNEEIKFDKSLAFLDSVLLDYNENFFSFEFAALDYNYSPDIAYSYMLEGLHYNWVFSGKNRVANFTHLDPGEYVFKVRTSLLSNEWIESNLRIAVIISPPIWMTWWFRVLIILTFLSVGPIFYYRRVNQLKKEKELQIDFSKQLIQSQEQERKRIASELHDSLGQDLLVIKNLALMNKSKDEQFEEISKTAGIAIDDVRRISYNLHPYQLDRLGLSKAIKSMFTNLEGVSKIKFHINIENVDNLFEKEKEINIFRIIQECVTNIIKHSDANNARVFVEKVENVLFIEIADNGKGFSFESAKSESKGFGLKNLENRVSFIGGKLEFKSDKEFKTQIIVKIPYSK